MSGNVTLIRGSPGASQLLAETCPEEGCSAPLIVGGSSVVAPDLVQQLYHALMNTNQADPPHYGDATSSFSSKEEWELVMASAPVLHEMTRQVCGLLNDNVHLYPGFTQLWMSLLIKEFPEFELYAISTEKIDFNFDHLFSIYVSALNTFKATGNALAVCRFFQTAQEAFERNGGASQFPGDLQGRLAFFDMLCKIFASRDYLSLLMSFRENNGEGAQSPSEGSSESKFQIAVISIKYTHFIFTFFTDAQLCYYNSFNKKCTREFSGLANWIQTEIRANRTTLSNTFSECSLLHDILRAYNRISLETTKASTDFYHYLRDAERVIEYWNVLMNSPALVSVVGGKIAGKKSTRQEDLRVVAEHREDLESIYLILKELNSIILSNVKKWEYNARLIADAHLFFKFGDMKRLKERLEGVNSAKKVDRILMQEIEKFIQKRNDPRERSLALQIIMYLSGSQQAELCKLRDSRVQYSNFCSQCRLMNEGLLQDVLAHCEKTIKGLQLLSKPVLQDLPIVGAAWEPTEIMQSLVEETPVESVAQVSSSTQPVIPLGDSFLERLVSTQNALQRYTGVLGQLCVRPAAKQALKNAQEHVEALLAVMRRFEVAKDKELFSVVNDCVRYGGIAIEQLLAVLSREGGSEEVSTHNLYELLWACPMTKQAIPDSIRRWICENNQGEILVRNVNAYLRGSSNLKKLLRDNYTYRDPHAPITAGEIGQGLLDYLRMLGTLSDVVQQQIYAFHELEIPEGKKELKEELISLCRGFCRKLEAIARIPEKEEIQFSSLRLLHGRIEQFFREMGTSEMGSHLNNLLTNVIPHLDQEMRLNMQLEPIDAYLHLGNTVLLNQIIVEEALSAILSAKGLFLSEEELKGHHLSAYTEKLGLKQRDFSPAEWQFLQGGHLGRQIVRYPFSFNAKGLQGHLKTLSELRTKARVLSKKQAATTEQRGFTPAHKETANLLKAIQQYVVEEINIVDSVVAKALRAIQDVRKKRN